MSLTLTAGDLARGEAASRVLLSPLAAPSVEAWRHEVMYVLCALFQADASLFGLEEGRGRYSAARQMDEAALTGCERYLQEASEGRGPSSDPAVAFFFAERRRQRFDAFNRTLLELGLGRERLRRSAFFNEVVVPNRLDHPHALYATTLEGEATVGIHHARPDAAPFGEGMLLLLRALLPAFRAGLGTLARFDAHRQALDGLAEALIVFGADHHELHRNAAFVKLLAVDPERERVLQEARHLARLLHPLGFPRAGAQGEAAFASPMRAVQTHLAQYALRGALLSPGTFGGDESVMISVQATPAAPAVLPSPEALRSRHGLTRREAEIALLLAEGLKNDEIAERLYISPHTVRRYA